MKLYTKRNCTIKGFTKKQKKLVKVKYQQHEMYVKTLSYVRSAYRDHQADTLAYYEGTTHQNIKPPGVTVFCQIISCNRW